MKGWKMESRRGDFAGVSYLAATGDWIRLSTEHSCLTCLYFHRNDFSIPALIYAYAWQKQSIP